MALTVREMIDLTKDHYHLQLLAGKDYLDYVVTWVHMMEDPSITEFFWGNELVVTSGYFLKDTKTILHLIDTLVEHRGTGLVINTGKYITTIPEIVYDYCDKKHFPLITMPWEVSITEFIRETCSIINQNNRNDELLAEIILHLVSSPQDCGTYRTKLDNTFQEHNGFQILCIKSKTEVATNSHITNQRSTMRLHRTLQFYSFPYLVFSHDQYFLFCLISQMLRLARKSLEKLLKIFTCEFLIFYFESELVPLELPMSIYVIAITVHFLQFEWLLYKI
ncbi:Transcriptional regulatory protein [Lachnospiraceae bacterium TWA4]|nr:Transcriptional regulatory protein [Lachnospiraceae bacterium TWA4]